MIVISIFYLGAIIGSFIGLVSYRLPLEKKMIFARSQCDSCGSTLKIYELIPIISFLIQRGRCRNCKEKIDRRILYVELINGLIFLLYFIFVANSKYFILDIIFLEILFIIGIIDYDYKIIPNILSLMLFILGLVRALVEERFIEGMYMSIIFLILVIILYILTNKGFGIGDIKVYVGLIYFLKIEIFILNIFLALIIASFYSLYKILKKELSKKDNIPFAPFIFISSIICIFNGYNIIDLYFKLTR